MGKEIQIVGQDNRPIIEGTYDIPAGLFVRENKLWAKYTDPETLETKETNVFDGAGTVLPTPTAADNGKVLGVVDGAYTFVEQSGGSSEFIDVDVTPKGNFPSTIQDLYDTLVEMGIELTGYMGKAKPLAFNIKYNDYSYLPEEQRVKTGKVYCSFYNQGGWNINSMSQFTGDKFWAQETNNFTQNIGTLFASQYGGSSSMQNVPTYKLPDAPSEAGTYAIKVEVDGQTGRKTLSFVSITTGE